MLNREKYAKEILDIVCEGDNFGLQNGKPVGCRNINCRECEFYSENCRANTRAWVNREYVEPPVDWSKVPVDAKILERQLKEPDNPHPINAKILTYENAADWDVYRAIGTPEECRAAVEKQTARKGIREKIKKGYNRGMHHYYCPVCYEKGDLRNKYNVGLYCSDCGQKLDWEDEK